MAVCRGSRAADSPVALTPTKTESGRALRGKSARANLPDIIPVLSYDRVSEPNELPRFLRTLTLHEVRGYLRRSYGRGLAVFIAVAYALGSMLLGGMLVLARYPGGYSVLFLWGNALGLQPWNYPGLLIEAPWGFVVLPFWATVSMILVSAGVGLGMAVAVLLSVQLIRGRRVAAGRPMASGTIAGLTPAMIALVTLGACCSTTAAATAGVGLVAQASGSTTPSLLLNNWFLGAFQIAVVYVALIAQELLLRMYGRLFAIGDPGFSRAQERPSPIDRQALVTGALRVALVAAGVTWILTVLADWTAVNPATASAGVWFNWLVEHWLLGGFAVVVALSPHTIRGGFLTVGKSAGATVGRAALLVGAWALGGWVPPPFAGAGVEGFGNEFLGLVGGPSAWGAVVPVFSPGLALGFQWGFQYLLLAIFAAVVAARPGPVLDWLAGSTEVAPAEPPPTAPTGTVASVSPLSSGRS
jgi:hypothetical protein